MTGKEKCNYLRGLRERIARENGIPYESTPCTYQGDDCLGTCPVCEKELRYLTDALQEKERRGEPVRPTAIWNLQAAHAGAADRPLREQEDYVGGLSYHDPEEEERKRKEALARWDGDTTICPFCGNSHRPEARCCIVCGQRLPEAPPHQSTPENNVPELRVCPHCGAIHTSAMRVCDECGAVLSGAQVASNQGDSLPPVAQMMDLLHSRVGRLLEQEQQEQIRKLKTGLDQMIHWVEQLERDAVQQRKAREERERMERDRHWFELAGVAKAPDDDDWL